MTARGDLPPINFGGGKTKKQGGLVGHIVPNDKESGMVCRICLEDEDPNDMGENPFITPCSCIGSMKYIHVQCVREWLDNRKQQQQLDGVFSYYWEELSCELCKSPLKLRN